MFIEFGKSCKAIYLHWFMSWEMNWLILLRVSNLSTTHDFKNWPVDCTMQMASLSYMVLFLGGFTFFSRSCCVHINDKLAHRHLTCWPFLTLLVSVAELFRTDKLKSFPKHSWGLMIFRGLLFADKFVNYST